jgi:glycerol kinase
MEQSRMQSDLYLGIDQGSSATKAVVIDGAGGSLASFVAPVPPRLENERCVEQDPLGLLESVREVCAAARGWAAQQGRALKAAGLALQRSGVLAWRASDGVPVHPMMTWADTRTYTIIQDFGQGVEQISQLTGLPTLPNFAAGKIHLLQRRFLEPAILVGTLDSFLVHRFSQGRLFLTEDTMAARTMLYGLREGGWSTQLCRAFKVDQRRLAAVGRSFGKFSEIDGIPLLAMIGDQQAALIGRSRQTARPVLNLGTIGALVVNTGAEIVQKPGLFTSVLRSRTLPDGYTAERCYLVETTNSAIGTVLLEPLRRGWCADSAELDRMCLDAATAEPRGRAVAYCVNRQPVAARWPDGVPNTIVVKEGATDADRARAVVENVGNLVVRMLEEFSDKGLLGSSFPAEIDVAGGASQVNYLVQYVADVSGHILHRGGAHDATARGAALCAWGAALGTVDVQELNAQTEGRTFRCEHPERRQRYLMWQRLEQDILRGELPSGARVESW